jgi:AraC-like DNA-binding protein
LEKNTLVIIPKESFHHFVVNGSEDDYHRYVLNFTPFGKLNPLIEEKMNDICLFPATEHILTHFKRLDKYAKTEDQHKKELALEAALTDILLDIEIPKNTNASSTPLLINPIIKNAVEYINKNANRITGIDEIAKEINVSASYFAHLFSKELHISPSKYLLEKKLVMANRMIDSGIGAVVASEQCGFANYSGFYKMYKKAFGISPSKTKQS